MAREIYLGLKNQITKEREFNNESEVIDYAIKVLYSLLKKQRLLQDISQDGRNRKESYPQASDALLIDQVDVNASYKSQGHHRSCQQVQVLTA